jgi:DNA-binding transcriptional LysR family regulator
MDVLHERFIAMPSEFELRQTTDALFAVRGVHMNVVLESAEIATIKALVGSGLGVAIVPGGPTAPAVAGVTLIPLSDEDAFRTIGLSWHLDRRLPAEQAASAAGSSRRPSRKSRQTSACPIHPGRQRLG